MKVIALTRYDRLGASSRVRFMQYFQTLDQMGVEVCMHPLFSDDYVRNLQAGKRNKWAVALAYLRRIALLMRLPSDSLFWVEKDALPWLPAWLEMLLLRRSRAYVLDYDDAVFHTYDQHKSQMVQKLLGKKHASLMRQATLVIAGNNYIAGYANAQGAKWVEVLPTVIDLARYSALPSKMDITNISTLPVVGWIGQRATAHFLLTIETVIKRLAKEGNASFHAVGINPGELGLPMKAIKWSEESEVDSIGQFDIGIMPLEDGPFERGKCGYKLIQYMACGIPVIASPVGVNTVIVEHGVNGYLASTEAEWEFALVKLLESSELRMRLGNNGREKVEQFYCNEVTGPRLFNLLLKAFKLKDQETVHS